MQEFLSESDEVCIYFILVLIWTTLEFSAPNLYLNFDRDLLDERFFLKRF